VLLAAAEHLGIDSDLVPKIATGFCSGVARTGGMCGALSGAVMALSMHEGREGEGYDHTELYEKIQQLVESFETKFGSTNCAQLLGLELGSEQGQVEYQQRNLNQQCAKYVGEAGRLVEALLG
jgi:C_GCAxxG_C_C family probable redox protein